MAEAIHCPSCSTRYRLRPERLKPVIRRAKCFSCGSIFPVGDIVQRLLALPRPGTSADFAFLDVADAPRGAAEEGLPLPTLTLSDLEGPQGSVLEETAIVVLGALPETHEAAPEVTATTLSGYTSARDAIEKLFGNEPAAAPALRIESGTGAMDIEASLAAMETTLGNDPNATAAMAIGAEGDAPTTPALTGEDLADPSRSTVRLSMADLQAALEARPSASQPMEEPVETLEASDLVGAEADPIEPAQPRAFEPSVDAPDAGAELLRLKIGEEIYGSLTMPQLIAWVDEGRILENHMVARQHSENWLEACKVPGLRPVFDRLRRERSGTVLTPPPTPSLPAPKKSLFGGLFGRN